MSVTTDKRKFNFIIACGYCLFVIIILFNYLTKAPKRTSYREGTRKAHDNVESYPSGHELENQLNEQRRMNKEMREMLIDIQNAKNANGSVVAPGSQVQNTNIETLKANASTVNAIDVKSVNLPELNSKIEDKFKKNAVCPFNMDRNPFASPEAVTEIADADENISFPGHSVICHPILPYVFSSSNSDFRVISNY
ncbi:MAG: hypothetical protein II961_01730 [Candidatus Riflebacteria bacterium]|nr:hypothetical protein [Candidatus Riflebacteria bacterium]